MKYVTEYRDGEKSRALASEILRVAGSKPMTFMEVCGTHTMSIARFGIRSLLPKTIRLISGPGCPVCVTPVKFIDHAAALARMPNAIICTFGDMMRVPGSTTSLEREHAAGADIRVVASTLDALAIARREKDREVVFLGVGFETTAPTIAASIVRASTEKIENYSVLPANKVILPALLALLAGPVTLDGIILPGHVSAIIGAGAFRELLREKGKAGAVAGFEPTDILSAILELVNQVAKDSPDLVNPYSRAVNEEGNRRAIDVMNEIFESCDAPWRGLGLIPGSGLKIRGKYARFDAAARYDVEVELPVEPAGCRCGEILAGAISPEECPLFGNSCTPEHPVGACMVSGEGTCAACHRYGNAR